MQVHALRHGGGGAQYIWISRFICACRQGLVFAWFKPTWPRGGNDNFGFIIRKIFFNQTDTLWITKVFTGGVCFGEISSKTHVQTLCSSDHSLILNAVVYWLVQCLTLTWKRRGHRTQTSNCNTTSFFFRVLQQCKHWAPLHPPPLLRLIIPVANNRHERRKRAQCYSKGHFPVTLLDRPAEESTHDSIWRIGRGLGKCKRCNEAF